MIIVYYAGVGGVLFFFNDPATTEIYTYCHTLSLHGSLPISLPCGVMMRMPPGPVVQILPALSTFSPSGPPRPPGKRISSRGADRPPSGRTSDRKSTRLNSSH